MIQASKGNVQMTGTVLEVAQELFAIIAAVLEKAKSNKEVQEKIFADLKGVAECKDVEKYFDKFAKGVRKATVIKIDATNMEEALKQINEMDDLPEEIRSRLREQITEMLNKD